MGYTKEQLDQIAARLESLPPVQPQHNKREAVKLLASSIESLKARGYTLEQIAAELTSNGLEISKSVLKNSLPRAKPAAAPKRKDKPKSAKVTEPVEAEKIEAVAAPDAVATPEPVVAPAPTAPTEPAAAPTDAAQ